MSEIVQDLCDHQHTFFYLKNDRKPCPYCEFSRLLCEGKRKDTVIEAARAIVGKDGIPESDFLRLETALAALVSEGRAPDQREWEVLPDEEGWTMTIRQPGEGDRGWIKIREVL